MAHSHVFEMLNEDILLERCSACGVFVRRYRPCEKRKLARDDGNFLHGYIIPRCQPKALPVIIKEEKVTEIKETKTLNAAALIDLVVIANALFNELSSRVSSPLTRAAEGYFQSKRYLDLKQQL